MSSTCCRGCPETSRLRKQFLGKECLHVNEDVADKETLRRTNKAFVIHRGRYLDNVKYKWYYKIRDL
jgi:hypothetical protein